MSVKYGRGTAAAARIVASPLRIVFDRHPVSVNHGAQNIANRAVAYPNAGRVSGVDRSKDAVVTFLYGHHPIILDRVDAISYPPVS